MSRERSRAGHAGELRFAAADFRQCMMRLHVDFAQHLAAARCRELLMLVLLSIVLRYLSVRRMLDMPIPQRAS